jgi:hypothetical protein
MSELKETKCITCEKPVRRLAQIENGETVLYVESCSCTPDPAMQKAVDAARGYVEDGTPSHYAYLVEALSEIEEEE